MPEQISGIVLKKSSWKWACCGRDGLTKLFILIGNVMIEFSCPGCSAIYSLPDDKAGKKGKCPNCRALFLVPNPLPLKVRSQPQPPAKVEEVNEDDEDNEVKIKPCPGCQASLTVSKSDLGVAVECPYCKQVFGAVKATSVGDKRAPDSPRQRQSQMSRESAEDEDEDEDDVPPRKRKRNIDREEPPSRPQPRRRKLRRAKSGSVTFVAVMNFLLGGLVCLCTGLVFMFRNMIQASMMVGQDKDENPMAQDTMKWIIIGTCLIQATWAIMAFVGGVGIVQRRTYGRILTIITASMALLNCLFIIYQFVLRILAQDYLTASGNFISLCIWMGYGLISLFILLNHGDEFD
ncbi:MAG: hypothetical protein U0798_05425 [Gemmataceae bacterium]